MYILECLSSKGKNIRIKSSGGPVVIGRSPETGIKDLRLSKEHFEVRPCVDKGGLKITHLGQNRSVIKSKVSSMGYSTILRPDDTIELLEGQYKYRLTVSSNIQQALACRDTTMDGPTWSRGLVASMSDPSNVLFEDADLCVIRDKYPKAKTHLLVLAKDPNLVTLKNLKSEHADLVRKMVKVGLDQAQSLDGVDSSEVKAGFHAVPSMTRLHLHVISQDFDSPCLKNKKHWNSFTTEFFLSHQDVVSQLETNGKVRQYTKEETEKWLKKDLVCHKCSYRPKNMPDLKSHLKSIPDNCC